MITPILLCGGSGTRLWPLSRKSYPKQFAHILGVVLEPTSFLVGDQPRNADGDGQEDARSDFQRREGSQG